MTDRRLGEQQLQGSFKPNEARSFADAIAVSLDTPVEEHDGVIRIGR
ncbi:hypothetical protein [Aurantiacibacter flavus]|uniref:Uncharacterized protein n=1 Tax=Aurantiacibacter flavus TaxID=3145232 RepID=A0ABV0D025_9SPHN